ncbi:hypothetical protein [Nonomuraea sp. NPDC002799]
MAFSRDRSNQGTQADDAAYRRPPAIITPLFTEEARELVAGNIDVGRYLETASLHAREQAEREIDASYTRRVAPVTRWLAYFLILTGLLYGAMGTYFLIEGPATLGVVAIVTAVPFVAGVWLSARRR